MYMPCLIHICDMTLHTCDMAHLYVWHDSFIYMTWPIHACDMTHSYMWHGPFIRVTWLIHTCDMAHLYVWHDSLQGSWVCITPSHHVIHTHSTHILMDMTHSPCNESCHTWMRANQYVQTHHVMNTHQLCAMPHYRAKTPCVRWKWMVVRECFTSAASALMLALLAR